MTLSGSENLKLSTQTIDSIHGNEKLICHFAEWFLGSFEKINYEHHSMDNPNTTVANSRRSQENNNFGQFYLKNYRWNS